MLAVDGVLLITETIHDDKASASELMQIVEVFREPNAPVSTTSTCRAHKASRMIGRARELNFPLMAGSSLPVTWRRPELEPALETPFEDGLVAAYGGIEVYGFHALEALQVMLERRRGGETGVRGVTCLTGNDVWKAGDAGRWSWDLLWTALAGARPPTLPLTPKVPTFRRTSPTLAVSLRLNAVRSKSQLQRPASPAFQTSLPVRHVTPRTLLSRQRRGATMPRRSSVGCAVGGGRR